jgi:hypothetical protein
MHGFPADGIFDPTTLGKDLEALIAADSQKQPEDRGSSAGVRRGRGETGMD